MKKEKKISDHRIFSDLSEEKRECVQENFDYILDEIKNWLKTNDEKYFFKFSVFCLVLLLTIILEVPSFSKA